MKKARFHTLLLLLALQVAGGSEACAGAPHRASDIRTIRGVVRVVGNEPFTHVVVTSPSDAPGVAGRIDYLIEGALAAELRARWQGRTVTLEGRDAAPSRPRFRYGFAPTRILGDDGGR